MMEVVGWVMVVGPDSHSEAVGWLKMAVSPMEDRLTEVAGCDEVGPPLGVCQVHLQTQLRLNSHSMQPTC